MEISQGIVEGEKALVCLTKDDKPVFILRLPAALLMVLSFKFFSAERLHKGQFMQR